MSRARSRFLIVATAVLVVLSILACGRDTTAPSGPAALHITAGDGASAPIGSAIDVAVTVVDSRGRPVAGVNVIWEKMVCCSLLSTESSATSDGGVARTSWTLQSAGEQTLNAFIQGMPLSPVTVHATAIASEGPSDFVVTVLGPRPDDVVGDSADVSVEVNTSRTLASVTASAGAGDTRLTYFSTSGTRTFWKGRVSLQGEPRNELVLTARAIDVNGGRSKGLVTIVHDRPPTIIVHAPLNNTVSNSTIDYWVDCVDDDPAGCARVGITAYPSSGSVQSGKSIASGTSTLKGTATLPQDSYSLQIDGVDSRGQVATAQRGITIITNPHLQELISGLGGALDYRSNRLLFAAPDSAPYRLAIRSSDGHEDLIALDSQRVAVMGALTSTGAAFGAQLPGMTAWTLNFWQGGNVTRAPGSYVTADFVADGDFVLCWTTSAGSLAATLRRHNVATNEDIQIASLLPANIHSLAPNGDVAFWRATGDWNVYWYHGGATTQVTSDGNQSAMNMFPVTDGTQVVFVRQTPCCNVGTPMYAIERFDGTAIAELAPPTAGPQPFPHQSYEARNSWMAFVKADAFSVNQVWTRSPSGEV